MMKFKVICTFLSMMSLLLNIPTASALSSSTSVYLEAKIFDVILPTCKSLFPHKKLVYSSRLQRWKAAHKKAISKGEEDMINLATMLGQSETLFTQKKVEAASNNFQQSGVDEKTLACEKIEAL